MLSTEDSPFFFGSSAVILMPDIAHLVGLAKQRLSRHLNEIQHIFLECQTYGTGMQPPANPLELLARIQSHKRVLSMKLNQLQTRINTISSIYHETAEMLLWQVKVDPNTFVFVRDFVSHWERRRGFETLVQAYILVNFLQLQLGELQFQEILLCNTTNPLENP